MATQTVTHSLISTLTREIRIAKAMPSEFVEQEDMDLWSDLVRQAEEAALIEEDAVLGALAGDLEALVSKHELATIE